MTAVIRVSAGLLLATALVACHRPAAHGDAQGNAGPAPATTAGLPGAAAPDAPVTLTMARARAYAQAMKNLVRAQEADPGIGDPAQNVATEDDARYAARLQASAKMRAAIEAAGLSTREFTRIGGTLRAALAVQGSGQLDAASEGVDPAAVEFVRQHDSELSALLDLPG